MKKFRKWLDLGRAGTDSYISVDEKELTIADCGRRINLDFDWGDWSDRSHREAVRKINVIRQALNVLEQNLEEK